jgi:putative FmdB family regulatory protein
MPLYEYACECGERFQRLEPMRSRPRKKCKCGRMAKRVISGGASLVFKGSGFYCTDYKGKK